MEGVRASAVFNSHHIYLIKNGFSILLHDEKKWGDMVMYYHDSLMHNHQTIPFRPDTLGFQLIEYSFDGANFDSAEYSNRSDAYYNYYIGDDPAKWVSDVYSYSKVTFNAIYPNIDLELEVIDQRFKYNFILKPGAVLSDIKLKINGHDGLKVKPNRLTLSTNFGEFSEVMPVSFQIGDHGNRVIQMNYIDYGSHIGFASNFIKTKVKTVIDPELIFSTYSGSSVDNFGFTATYDEDGNLYSGGIATGPTKFLNGVYPTTPGAFDVVYNGGEANTFACDIALSKYSSDGQNLIYATYLGGNMNDYPHSLIVDDMNQLIVFGTSASTNYPATINAYDETHNGSEDIIVTKFNANGTSLIGSTFIGGSGNDGINNDNTTRYFYADDYRGEVNIDATGNIYIATSSSSFNFPTTSGVFQQSSAGLQEGVIVCFSSDLSTLKWSSFLGGSGGDAIYSVDVSSSGDLYITGGTSSYDLLISPNAYQGEYGGETDGFIACISLDGSEIKQATYFGSTGYDQTLQLEIGKYGNIYVVGHSEQNIPTKGLVYFNNSGKQFISKFNPTLSELLVSSVYGSGGSLPDITINAFLVDDCNKIYVSGWGSNSESQPNNTLSNMPITDDAFQRSTDGQDFHLIVFEEDLADLSFATYFGGDRTGDHVDGGTSRFDKRGIVYQSVCSSCPNNEFSSRISDFPTTPGSFSETNPSPRCSNASFKMAVVPFNQPPDVPQVSYVTSVIDTLNIQIGDTFAFNYPISDPDGDSIYVYFNIPSRLISRLIRFDDSLSGKGNIDAYFSMLFSCAQAGDTYEIIVEAEDRGCPSSIDSVASILIEVDEPPVLPPPDVLCLNFISDDELRIEWESTELSDYFSKMTLYKIDPNNNRTVLMTTTSQLGGFYLDTDVEDPRNRDYTYYLVVENICGQLGDKSYNLSSVRESEIPVEETYLKTATVSGQEVHVVFLQSKEDDFGRYEIYKRTRDKGTFTYLASISDVADTVFVDSDVNVNTTSYCYQIRVVDNCGHLSAFSNIGCTIVIRGESINDENASPRFSFNLEWDEYLTWDGEIDHYQLLRAVDTGLLRPIVSVDYPIHNFRDVNLDYDWGGYWFSVIAHEGSGGLDATSRSNDIYLIQPPLVFVPNAITSNGDNLNDVFGWSDVFVKNFNIKVYNRWGEKVYETSDKNAGWSGVYKQSDIEYSNVYFWIVSYKGWDNLVYYDHGTLTILK